LRRIAVISDAENVRLLAMLENLSTVLDQLDERPQEFIKTTLERYDKYEQRIMLSAKQWEWLDDLHRKYCKHAPPLPSVKAGEGGDRLDDDDDDEPKGGPAGDPGWEPYR
jgi:hypothetical protein